MNEKELSLLSKLNINDQINVEQSPHLSMISFDKYSCDLRSITSKKRKLSEEFINVNASKIGHHSLTQVEILSLTDPLWEKALSMAPLCTS
jgi:hypothetical protein